MLSETSLKVEEEGKIGIRVRQRLVDASFLAVKMDEWGHKPKDVGSLQKLEKARKWKVVPPESTSTFRR